ncbi:predicted protein [Streptomyces viridosporus ATCC 14672]|uniref:Predicted protein n=1 Tax=Streptomyces viridosporus (strain ATCC 14672 / DSM 40746 / JCM 4963 / KCTC 9882 / NRRL B-12104 / FH 1290) TaxID=566461 RepID=D6A8N0_STRV1|nr:predicted protein [Streptomyces viridosporus ATCC 14672]
MVARLLSSDRIRQRWERRLSTPQTADAAFRELPVGARHRPPALRPLGFMSANHLGIHRLMTVKSGTGATPVSTADRHTPPPRPAGRRPAAADDACRALH